MEPPGSEDFRARSKRKSNRRKTHQLCAQVHRALAFQLQSEWSDSSLHGLYVESVTPHPNASRMLVVLRPLDPTLPLDLATVLSRLADAKPGLRLEIGRATNRKKTPDLAFHVWPATDHE